MDLDPPLTILEWRVFLSSYCSEFMNSEFLRYMEAEGRAQYCLSEEQRHAQWLGYEPASEDEVLDAEERLGIRLPPTYRNFLLTSNGWSTICYSVDLLKSTEIGWFADLEAELLAAWSGPEMYLFSDLVRLLERCLLISNDDGGAGHYLLLHADSVTENGEWTAYEWWPSDGEDPEQHDNFATMVLDLWKTNVAAGLS